MSEDLSPCPRCGSHDIQFTNCRDLNVLDSFLECQGCDLRTFRSETITFLNPVLPNLDYETTVMKYNAWCKTNPKQYGEEVWQ